MTTITDRKLLTGASYSPVVQTATDYYAFGAPIAERSFNASGYRYGFNTQEKTDEIAGAGNHTTALFWEYDTRSGRRWNLDPKPMTGVSEYAAFNNNPVWYSDALGDSIVKLSIYDKSGFIHGSKDLYVDHTIISDVTTVLEGAAKTQTHIHLNSSFRTNKKQATLNNQNAVTPTKSGNSSHNAGLALDFNLYKNNNPDKGTIYQNKTVTDDEKIISDVKAMNDWRWGGDFKKPDRVHIDKRGSDANFKEMRDANQKQMNGNMEKENNDRYINRKETIIVKSNE